MCIAILKTKEGKITDEALRNSFKSNPDGAGIACTVNGALKIVKGIFNEDKFVELVRQAEKVCDNNILIHCRIGTSGLKDANNTHPFMVNDRVCLIHNGILDVDVPKGSKINDTQIFIEKYMKNFSGDDLIHNGSLHNLIEEVIGNNNKFVMMNNQGEYKIINESAGHWVDGVWYSNYGYQPRQYTTWGNWNSKYDDDYMLSDEYMLSGYGENARRINNETYGDILDAIDSMTIAEIENIGYYPYYDFDRQRICMFGEAVNAVALEELSKDLYDYYFEFAENIYNEDEEVEYEIDNDDCEIQAT